MFGEKHQPPKPSRYEALIMLGVAVVITLGLTGAYLIVLFVAQAGSGQ